MQHDKLAGGLMCRLLQIKAFRVVLHKCEAKPHEAHLGLLQIFGDLNIRTKIFGDRIEQ